MKLYMRQKVFSFRDKTFIYDEAGNEKYYIESEIFSFGKKIHMYDILGNELCYIEQELLTFLPRYKIYRLGKYVCEVKKEFTFFHPKYTVLDLDWTVDGDFFDHDYDITDESGNIISSVSKEWFTLGDAYLLNIHNEYETITAIAITLIIDACLDAQSRNN